MRRIAHLTPRYVYNRLKYVWYEKTHAEEPWLVPGAIHALQTLLLPTDDGIEWGSGRSTRWFAKRLRHLVSVEANQQWFEVVRKQLSDAAVKNVDYRLHVLADESDAESPYTHAADDIADGTLGFALVDGAARGICSNVALSKLKPGGVLVIDNVHWFVDHPTPAPASRNGKGPVNQYWAEFVQQTREWRRIIFSNGVNDTGIWFKPCPPATS
jgi:predicted O-methyltransferase YrrM